MSAQTLGGTSYTFEISHFTSRCHAQSHAFHGRFHGRYTAVTVGYRHFRVITQQSRSRKPTFQAKSTCLTRICDFYPDLENSWGLESRENAGKSAKIVEKWRFGPGRKPNDRISRGCHESSAASHFTRDVTRETGKGQSRRAAAL